MYSQFPYQGFNPTAFNPISSMPSASNGLLGLAKKTFNWDTFLNNAQRTLNVINQAMPIYNQVRPMFRNMGTIFKVIGELNSAPSISSASTITNTTNAVNSTISGTPQFFA